MQFNLLLRETQFHDEAARPGYGVVTLYLVMTTYPGGKFADEEQSGVTVIHNAPYMSTMRPWGPIKCCDRSVRLGVTPSKLCTYRKCVVKLVKHRWQVIPSVWCLIDFGTNILFLPKATTETCAADVTIVRWLHLIYHDEEKTTGRAAEPGTFSLSWPKLSVYRGGMFEAAQDKQCLRSKGAMNA